MASWRQSTKACYLMDGYSTASRVKVKLCKSLGQVLGTWISAICSVVSAVQRTW